MLGFGVWGLGVKRGEKPKPKPQILNKYFKFLIMLIFKFILLNVIIQSISTYLKIQIRYQVVDDFILEAKDYFKSIYDNE